MYGTIIRWKLIPHDRIATISKGSIVGVFNEGEVTEREIGIMMAGSKKSEEKSVEKVEGEANEN